MVNIKIRFIWHIGFKRPYETAVNTSDEFAFALPF